MGKYSIKNGGDALLKGVWQVGKTVPLVIDGVYEDVSDGGRYCHCLKIVFEENEGNVVYKGIAYEEFTKEKLGKYVYMRGGANGGDRTPTSKFVEAVKTTKRIITSLKDLLKSEDDSTSKEIFRQILSLFESTKEQIEIDLDNKVKAMSFERGEGLFITITVYKDGKEMYMGDFDIVVKKLLKASSSKYFDKYKTISKGEGVCYFCAKNCEVYGFVNTYNSYTVDKAGFVSGGFNQQNAWRNYPVCDNCAKELENGKIFIENNMSSKFCGFNYAIIPKVTFGNKDDIEKILDLFEDYEKRKFSLGDETRMNLLKSEKDFIEIMSKSENNLNYNMLIYREENSGAVFRILAFIEDIVPSRLKNILKIKMQIETEDYFNGLKGKEDVTYNMKYSFEFLRHFFPNNKMEGNFDKSFLEIINNIFSNRNVSYEFILNKIMQSVSVKFSNNDYFENLLLEGFMNLRFVESLKLFNSMKKGENDIMIERNEKNKMFLDYLGQHQETFNSDAKKAVFLTGVLTDKLLNIQYKERKSKPFYSRLNGLKLNRKLIKRIFTEAINKLNEYNKNYYAELESIIAEYMVSKDTMSDDETSFFFTLGMTLSKKIKIEEEEINND